MKKRALLILCGLMSIFICLFSLSACGQVEFEINFIVDGEEYATVKTSGLEVIKLPDNPTKEGCTFDGWYWDEDIWQNPFTANSILNAPLSSDMKVYCKWKDDSKIDDDKDAEITQPEMYSIRLVYGNGQADKIITQGYGTQIESIGSPTREGYIFDGWDKTIPAVMPAENMIITAQWIAIFTHDGSGKITGLSVYGKTLKEITIPSTIDNVSIIEIGDEAFKKYYSLKSIVIPDSVISIGSSAFSGCSGLTSVTIGSGVTSIGNSAFYDCDALTSIVIPDSVTSIGGGVFAYCNSLISVTIGENVTSIGGNVFYGCYKLVEAINKSELDIDERVWGTLDTGYTYPLKVKTSGESDIVNKDGYLFYTYGEINYLLGYLGTETTLTLPNNYGGQNYEIYKYAFLDCDLLESVVMGNGVTSIGDRAFYDCDSLTSVTIPNSIISIGGEVFDKCDSLKYNVYNNTKYLGNSNNPYLVLVKVLNKDISSCEINENCKVIYWQAFEGCTALTTITIPDSVTYIGGEAFCGCTSLKSVTIPNGLTLIGASAFCYCTSLTNIVIPDSVTLIGSYAFRKCSSLTIVTIGSGVTSMYNGVFKDCVALTSIVFKDTTDWYITSSYSNCLLKDGGTEISVVNSSTNVTYFKSTY